MTIEELLTELRWNCPNDLPYQVASLFFDRLAELERRVAAVEKPMPKFDSNTMIGPDTQPTVHRQSAAEPKPASSKPKSGAEWRERHGKVSWPLKSGCAWSFDLAGREPSVGKFEKCNLPMQVFNLLKGGARDSYWITFATREAANAALDAALLACGEIEPDAKGIDGTAISSWPEANEPYSCRQCGSRARINPANKAEWGCAQCGGSTCSLALNFSFGGIASPTNSLMALAARWRQQEKESSRSSDYEIGRANNLVKCAAELEAALRIDPNVSNK